MLGHRGWERRRTKTIHLCEGDDVPWGTTHRTIQTLLECLNRQVPTIQELVDFFLVPSATLAGEHDGGYSGITQRTAGDYLEPHDIGVWLLCVHGITSTCVLLALDFPKTKNMIEYQNKVSKRTTLETYTTYPNEKMNYDRFMDKMSKTSAPVIINNGEQSYIILEMIYNNKNKSGAGASLRIGDPLTSHSNTIPWVSAKRFLHNKGNATGHWMCIFIDP